ncbi:Uncharacterised protein [Mycobacteroides abscessus subsp. massiliense]|nr:Uncharacterised protein [Mycobacteroides abscessus subsp. massiliense]
MCHQCSDRGRHRDNGQTGETQRRPGADAVHNGQHRCRCDQAEDPKAADPGNVLRAPRALA